jgi:hypothetical protein
VIFFLKTYAIESVSPNNPRVPGSGVEVIDGVTLTKVNSLFSVLENEIAVLEDVATRLLKVNRVHVLNGGVMVCVIFPNPTVNRPEPPPSA